MYVQCKYIKIQLESLDKISNLYKPLLLTRFYKFSLFSNFTLVFLWGTEHLSCQLKIRDWA